MQIIQKIRCPNCGSEAERYYISSDHLTRTQCQSCDYLMVMCSVTGKVIEAYAPGIYPTAMISLSEVVHKPHPLPNRVSNGHSPQSVAAVKR